MDKFLLRYGQRLGRVWVDLTGTGTDLAASILFALAAGVMLFEATARLARAEPWLGAVLLAAVSGLQARGLIRENPARSYFTSPYFDRRFRRIIALPCLLAMITIGALLHGADAGYGSAELVAVYVMLARIEAPPKAVIEREVYA